MTKEELITKLAQLGVFRVVIDYDGQGDEGYVGDINLFDIEGTNITKTYEAMKATDWQLDEVAYDMLYNHHLGWEINEGAFGTITIHVATGKIENNHDERYESSTESNEQW